MCSCYIQMMEIQIPAYLSINVYIFSMNLSLRRYNASAFWAQALRRRYKHVFWPNET